VRAAGHSKAEVVVCVHRINLGLTTAPVILATTHRRADPSSPSHSSGIHEDTSYLISASVLITLILFLISILTLSITLLRYLKHRREKRRREQALRRVRELRPGMAESAVKRDESGKGRSVWERGEWEGVPVSPVAGAGEARR